MPDQNNPTCDLLPTGGRVVKGIKAHAAIGGFARRGVEVIRPASRVSRETMLPSYIHFGPLSPLPQDGNRVDPGSILF